MVLLYKNPDNVQCVNEVSLKLKLCLTPQDNQKVVVIHSPGKHIHGLS